MSDEPVRSGRGTRFDRHPWLTFLALGVLVLAIAEATLQFANPGIFQFVVQARRLHRYSDQWKVDLVPDRAVHLYLDGGEGGPLLNFLVTTDADGQRTYDRPQDHGASPPPPGAAPAPPPHWVHAIGDSYTMGWGVDYTSSWPAWLDALLPDGTRVLNQGVDGFGTLAATEKSMALWTRYPAGVAVYLFSPNDFEDDAIALAVRQRPWAVHAAFHALDWLRARSYVANVPFALKWGLHLEEPQPPPFRGKRLRLDGAAPAPPYTLLPVPALPPEDPPNPSELQLSRYRDFVRGKGARLLVFIIGDAPESRRFHRFCADHGIAALRFEMQEDGRLRGSRHFNAAGNLALARLVQERMGK